MSTQGQVPLLETLKSVINILFSLLLSYCLIPTHGNLRKKLSYHYIPGGLGLAQARIRSVSSRISACWRWRNSLLTGNYSFILPFSRWKLMSLASQNAPNMLALMIAFAPSPLLSVEAWNRHGKPNVLICLSIDKPLYFLYWALFSILLSLTII